MHYIIGTRICITGNMSPQISGPRNVSAKPTRVVNRSTPFEPGHQYNLHTIKYNKNESVYEYVFVNESTQQLLELKFKGTREADECISNALGDQLPDYDKFYKNSSG